MKGRFAHDCRMFRFAKYLARENSNERLRRLLTLGGPSIDLQPGHLPMNSFLHCKRENPKVTNIPTKEYRMNIKGIVTSDNKMSLFGQNDDSSDGEEKGLMENTNAYLCCYKSNQSHRASVLNDKDSSMATINIKGIVTSDNQMSLFEDNDDSSDDEEEDIMENINVYLNDKDSSFATLTTDEMTPPDKSRNSPSDKKVSFLMDHEAGIESKRDLERSREELLAKIKHLTNLLKGK